MRSKIKKLSWRILFIPVSGLFVLYFFALFGRSINFIFYDLTGGFPLGPETRDKFVFGFLMFWMISLFCLELSAAFLKNFRLQRLLTNLRFAPVAISLFTVTVILIFDLGMIEYSKWRIRNYVYSESNLIEKPDFRPHVDYRGWCGNGYSARESGLYFDVAAEGIDDENPKVRARALLMTLEVRDFLNGGDQTKLDDVLRKACRDTDFEVWNLAEKHFGENSGCLKFLSSN